jgi:hypothetical protein
VPVGKDPGDTYRAGVDIFTWVFAGMPPVWRIGQTPFARKGLQVAGGAPAVQNGMDVESSDKRAGLPETVIELGDMLRRFPVRIVNTVERTAMEHPKTFKNADVCNRISALLYRDPECIAYLNEHSEELIDGRNFYHG